MNKVRMLDCTLRDGGCVNNFKFGSMYMDIILHGVEESGIEIVELGYIDSKAGSGKDRTQFCNEQMIVEHFLKRKKDGVTYVAMIDYGKYNPDDLPSRDENSIDGIRLAFHKKNRKDILEWGRKILNKGFELFIQPMTCLRYSDAEMLDLINDVNSFLPDASAFYIVDSFGEMRLNEMYRIANLVDHNLNCDIALGLHSHNNLQLSYSNAVTLLNFPTERNMIFDASIMGMGKGAGNMATELFAEHLNLYRGKKYRLMPLLEVIDRALNQIRENYTWGYSIEYYLSAANHCTPSYASHFYRKHMLPIEQVAELLGMIEESKKLSFDKEYADKLYYHYNEQQYDDTEVISILKDRMKGKKILIIAPGRSVISKMDILMKISADERVITIALNNNPSIYCDYIFVTKLSVYNVVKDCEAIFIATSNLALNEKNILKVNYNSLNKFNGDVSDNSTVMLINLLKKIGVRQIMLAGFDGFSKDIDANYYNEVLKRPVDKEQAERRNELIKNYIHDAKKYMSIEFLTFSPYE